MPPLTYASPLPRRTIALGRGHYLGRRDVNDEYVKKSFRAKERTDRRMLQNCWLDWEGVVEILGENADALQHQIPSEEIGGETKWQASVVEMWRTK